MDDDASHKPCRSWFTLLETGPDAPAGAIARNHARGAGSNTFDEKPPCWAKVLAITPMDQPDSSVGCSPGTSTEAGARGHKYISKAQHQAS